MKIYPYKTEFANLRKLLPEKSQSSSYAQINSWKMQSLRTRKNLKKISPFEQTK